MIEKSKKLVKIISTLVIILVILALILVFKKPPLTEREKFIEANTLITCEILKNPSLSIDLEKSKEISNEIFSRYDFPIENNETMLTIIDKYENDETILSAIQEKLSSECELEAK